MVAVEDNTFHFQAMFYLCKRQYFTPSPAVSTLNKVKACV